MSAFGLMYSVIPRLLSLRFVQDNELRFLFLVSLIPAIEQSKARDFFCEKRGDGMFGEMQAELDHFFSFDAMAGDEI